MTERLLELMNSRMPSDSGLIDQPIYHWIVKQPKYAQIIVESYNMNKEPGHYPYPKVDSPDDIPDLTLEHFLNDENESGLEYCNDSIREIFYKPTDIRDMIIDLLSLEEIPEDILKDFRYYTSNNTIIDKLTLINYLVNLFEDGEPLSFE